MKKVIYNSKTAVFFLSLFFIASSGSAQFLDMQKDTVSFINVKAAHEKYKQEMKSAGKKATTYVTFSVETLNEIISRCKNAGVDSIQFLICTIGNNDMAQYTGKNPGLSDAAKKDLIGRQNLIIKVKRSAFLGQPGSHIGKPHFPSAIVSLLASGFVLLDTPDGFMRDSDYLYFSVSKICPPPASCN